MNKIVKIKSCCRLYLKPYKKYIEEQELANLVERLDKTSAAYGMEISAKKTKLMTNNTQSQLREVWNFNSNKLQVP